MGRETKREKRVVITTGRGDERGWGDRVNSNHQMGP